MNPRLASYAERAVPRYTSYPPATHFAAAVDARTYGSWLGELPQESRLSLYLHVPYCRELCWYCGCHTVGTRRNEPVADYVAMLMREVDLVAHAAGSRKVTAIHWGGGTPNILTPADFAHVTKQLAFWFDLDELEEHAIEIDPRHLGADQAEQFAASGVTRASLGVQDLNPHVQRAMGRVQPLEQVAQAVALLRAAGIARISMDIMYGLPGQTLDDVVRTARLARELEPDRVAMFGYAHVPWFKPRQRLIDAALLPDARARLEQADAARREWVAAGYEAVGFDHFAKPGDALALAARAGAATRTFQGYSVSEGDAIIGLGASAISTLPQGYAQNTPDIRSWRSAIAGERFATARGHAFTPEDRKRAALINDLLCAFAADLSTYGGAAAFAEELEALAPLIGDGLAVLQGDILSIPEEARPLARIVAAAFDTYARNQSRHSPAI
jgi:oxygen-independent coproporphyrinogen-3 oxidase